MADGQIRWARNLNSQRSESPAQLTWFQPLSFCRGTRQPSGGSSPAHTALLSVWEPEAFGQSRLGDFWWLKAAGSLGRKAALFVPTTGKNSASLRFSQLILLHLFAQLMKICGNTSEGLENYTKKKIRPIKWEGSQHQNNKTKNPVGFWSDTN